MKEKANYCLNCPIKPCSNKGCPLGNNIPSFIKAVKEEDYKKAYEILSETTVLQSVCGRICPHTKQCEGSCVRGIKSNPVSIGELEAYVGDIAIKENYKIGERNTENSNKKIAIIGGGPAGITAGAFLLKNGYSVTLYEKYNYLGGLLVHGIPEFRLPKDIVKNTIQKVIDLGLQVQYNMELGKNLELKELEEEYDAIFLAFGANITTKMGVEGEELKGVYGGNQLLENNKHPDYKNKTVAIIGGGNVAMDCARTIKRLGAKEVKVIYRREEEQMPAEPKEVEEAKNEDIEFLFKNNIVKIIGEQQVEKIELIKTELVEKEGETRKVPINIADSNYILEIDYVIMALGSKPENMVKNLNIEIDKWGYIKIDENNRTSNPKIFAGGDIAGAKGTVAWAAKSGRDAAEAIIKYLKKEPI
ncbi:MAG: FAD-dependent oxidoreductase [Clostridia bacterium]|nr:FAD-dependent oxidoreductase [Clostridia bacterium]